MIRKIRNAVSLLRRDPAMLAHVLRYRLHDRESPIPPMSGRMRKAPNGVSKTVADVVKAVKDGAGYNRILVYGDAAFYEAIVSGVRAADCLWASSNYADHAQGAENINRIALSDFDCVVVGGPGVGPDYRHVLRLMHAHDCYRPTFWAADGFEFCAGTLPVPAECSDADVYIFNHFEDFFGLKDPLQVKIEVFDQVTSKIEWLLLPPRRGLKVNLNEWLPNRQGPACISQFVAHPVLTRGRHYRWRGTGHLLWADSATSLHGGHDFRGPASDNEFKVSRAILNKGNLVITLPNYDLDATEEGAVLECIDGQVISSRTRSRDRRIEQLDFRNDGVDSGVDDYVGCKYKGYGASFWFSLDDAVPGPRGDHRNIASNHSARAPLRVTPDRLNGVEAALPLITGLSDAGVMLHPHAVPVSGADDPVEFGFEFDANVPRLGCFSITAFDHEGALVTAFKFEKTDVGPAMARDVLGELDPVMRDRVGLIVVAPDWVAMDLDPRGRGPSGNLVARHRSTHDFDVTEFQSCWRNLGIQVNEFPHWLSQDRMLAGRTNVFSSVPAGAKVRPAVLLVNGSGARDYANAADYRLRLLNPTGVEIVADGTLGPFCHQMVWLDEAFAEQSAHLDDTFGTLLVQSYDADLNANLIVVWRDQAVSLQHMWGY